MSDDTEALLAEARAQRAAKEATEQAEKERRAEAGRRLAEGRKRALERKRAEAAAKAKPAPPKAAPIPVAVVEVEEVAAVEVEDAADEAGLLADGALDFREAAKFKGVSKLPEHTRLGLNMLNIRGPLQTPKEENIDEWFTKAARRMLPEALATVAAEMRSDNPQRRLDAAEKILRVNGVDRRQAVDGGNATLVVNLGNSASAFEWLKKPVVSGAIVKKDEDK